MDDRVVLFFYYLGTFLGYQPECLLDPQTKEPSWKVIRMVSTVRTIVLFVVYWIVLFSITIQSILFDLIQFYFILLPVYFLI